MTGIDQLRRFKIHKSVADVDAVLRYIVRVAHRDVPFYRRTWGAVGVEVNRFRGTQDLSSLPLTTKQGMLSRGLSDRISRRGRSGRTISRVTSGMSGANLEVHMNRAEVVFRQVILASRMWRDARWTLPFNIVQAGAWIPPMSNCEVRVRRTPLGQLVHISRRLPISAQVEALARSRPTVLTGCPSNLEILAYELDRLGIPVVRPRLVVTRGEILRPQVRELLGKVFDCRVTDYYSAEETGLIAWQCPDVPDIMHINRSSCLVEITDDEGRPVGPGQEGIVAVTNLFNTTMPFIRYVLGDRSALLQDVPSQCQCGHGVQSILPPAGRSDDLVVLPDQRKASPRLVDDLVYIACEAAGLKSHFSMSVRDYQIVQDEPTLITVRFLTDCDAPAIVLATLGKGIRALHPDLRCDVVCVPRLDCEVSGKRKRVVSRIG